MIFMYYTGSPLAFQLSGPMSKFKLGAFAQKKRAFGGDFRRHSIGATGLLAVQYQAWSLLPLHVQGVVFLVVGILHRQWSSQAVVQSIRRLHESHD